MKRMGSLFLFIGSLLVIGGISFVLITFMGITPISRENILIAFLMYLTGTVLQFVGNYMKYKNFNFLKF